MGHREYSLIPGGDGAVGVTREVGQARSTHNKPPDTVRGFEDYAPPTMAYIQPAEGVDYDIGKLTPEQRQQLPHVKSEDDKKKHEEHDPHEHGVWKHVFNIYRNNKRGIWVSVLASLTLWYYL